MPTHGPVEDICKEGTAYTNVDSTTEAFTNGHGFDLYWTEEFSFSDGNYHGFNIFDGVAKAEFIKVDNYHYSRELLGDGTWSEWHVQDLWPFDDIPTTDDLLDDSGSPALGDMEDSGDEAPVGQTDDFDDEGVVFCGSRNLIDLKFEGHTKVNGIPVRHYTASGDMDWLDDDELSAVNMEWWVSAEGEVIRYFEELLGTEDGDVVYRETATWHGHGEKNVIAAPVIP